VIQKQSWLVWSSGVIGSVWVLAAFAELVDKCTTEDLQQSCAQAQLVCTSLQPGGTQLTGIPRREGRSLERREGQWHRRPRSRACGVGRWSCRRTWVSAPNSRSRNDRLPVETDIDVWRSQMVKVRNAASQVSRWKMWCKSRTIWTSARYWQWRCTRSAIARRKCCQYQGVTPRKRSETTSGSHRPGLLHPLQTKLPRAQRFCPLHPHGELARRK